MWTEHRFISFDKTPIFYRRLKTSNTPKGVVLIIHGMGEHGGRYCAFAEYLAERQLESIIPDLRGFGRSGGTRACVRRFSDFHEDLKALHSLGSRHQKGIPFFLLGHSFGGLVASSYLALSDHPKVQGLVLSSPIFGIAMAVPRWRHYLGMVSSYLLPDYTQASGVKPPLLTHDVDMLHRYLEDPLIFHALSARLYRELVLMMRRKKQIAAKITEPVLVLQAGDDAVVSKKETLAFYDFLKAEDKEIEVYPHFYHEILNEVDRIRVFSRIGSWLLKHIDHK